MSEDIISIILSQKSYLEQWNDTKNDSESIDNIVLTDNPCRFIGTEYIITHDGKLINLRF